MTPIKRTAWGYRAGFRAYQRGKDRSDNPFIRLVSVPEMHDSWGRGWRDANRGRREEIKP